MTYHPVNRTSSDTVEWYTPEHILHRVRQVLGQIDVDPASCAEANARVMARHYYTKERSGLAVPWWQPDTRRGSSVWLNPPYGRDDEGRSLTALWLDKLYEELREGRVVEAIVILNAFTGNAWFKPLWRQYLCFPDERVKFIRHGGAPGPQPRESSVLAYFGTRPWAFETHFANLGQLIAPEGFVGVSRRR